MTMKKEILKFLPLMIFYIIVIRVFSSSTFQGDEGGYVAMSAQLLKLLKGQFLHSKDIILWWGPGYPLILLPFLILKLPLFIAKLLNAFFLFGAVLYFYKLLYFYFNKKNATSIALVMGLYPPFMKEIYLLHTETFVFFLICGFMFHYCRCYRKPENMRIHLLLASVYLGYLCLTKVIFGYVCTVGLLIFLLIYLLKRKNNLRKTIVIYLLALCYCLPYLFCTCKLTGKIFYWGTSGGLSLYWISTPYKEELGSWFSMEDVYTNPHLSRHREYIDKIRGLNKVNQDYELKKQATYNIRHHPVKYLKNWLANVGRLLFSYPFSYGTQNITTYFYMIPNMFIVVLLVLGVYPAVKGRRLIPFEIYSLLFFSIIAFGGSSLLSAFDRQIRPIFPILFLWIAYIYLNIMKIRIRVTQL